MAHYDCPHPHWGCFADHTKAHITQKPIYRYYPLKITQTAPRRSNRVRSEMELEGNYYASCESRYQNPVAGRFSAGPHLDNRLRRRGNRSRAGIGFLRCSLRRGRRSATGSYGRAFRQFSPGPTRCNRGAGPACRAFRASHRGGESHAHGRTGGSPGTRNRLGPSRQARANNEVGGPEQPGVLGRSLRSELDHDPDTVGSQVQPVGGIQPG